MSDETQRLYVRPLPSGGYVAIEAQPVRTLFGPVKIRGQIIVERRPPERRVGHRAPVAACAEQTKVRDVINALFPIAHSDQALNQVLGEKVTLSVVAGRKRNLSSLTG
jgi:hypothetical protein